MEQKCRLDVGFADGVHIKTVVAETPAKNVMTDEATTKAGCIQLKSFWFRKVYIELFP